ncbi:hypothetical protein [Microcella sp.]|uniref:hypothetical protein n=1 Tax=Microcella sp. TaxID=1913979 RepID=UPI003F702E41
MTDLEPSAAPAAVRSRGARIGRGILIGVAAVCILAQSAVLASAGWAVANPRAVTDAVTVWQYDATPAISGYATRAAMSERGRFLFYASTPEVVPGDAFDAVCSRDEPDIGVLGCYTLADGRIYLYDITNPDLDAFEVVVAAHEMLHAAWDRLTPEEQAALAAPLEEAFAAVGPESELVERIAAYEDFDPASRIPELYAIVGTELSEIPPVLEEHYAQFFDDRTTVVALWKQVEAIFLELEAELDRLSTELARLAAEIDAEQAAAEQSAAVLEADIAAFNERASRPGGYTSQSAFERDRQSLVDRQSALSAAIDATNAKVDAYNDLVDEFTALNEQAAALDKDLNIDPQRLETSE